MEFTARLTKPTDQNPYYIRKTDGGYSPCIAGKPKDKVLTALANCVGWAVGRFNEIGGYCACKYLGSTNAENFVTMAKAQGLTVQQEPTLGGCLVWAKGKVGDGSDGAGHVAIVEQINADGSVVTSESGYNYKAFYTTKRSGKNWGQNGAYTYLGCIVNPAVKEEPETTGKEIRAKGVAKSFEKSLSGSYNTTANLRLRDGAGMDQGVLTVLPKGSSVRCYGYYTALKGVKWLYVQAMVDGVLHTGFCSSDYLAMAR